MGELFSKISSIDEIPARLKLYESIRRPRTEKIQKGALENGDIWHMPDGEQQIARDAAMKQEIAVAKGATKTLGPLKNPNQWSDDDFQPWLFGHDAILEARNRMTQGLSQVEVEITMSNL